MSKNTFIIFLLALMGWGLTAVLPSNPALGQEPGDALMIRQNSDGPIRPRLTAHDLKQIYGRGPMPPGVEPGGPQAPLMLALSEKPETPVTPAPSENLETPVTPADAPSAGPTFGPSFGPALPPDEGPGPSAPMPDIPANENPDVYDVPANQESLYRELRELRKDVDRLRQEAEARESLLVKEEETRDKEEEILDAAGREYSLMKPGMLGMDLSAAYTYNSYDVIRDLYRQQGTDIEYRSDHTITNNFSLEIPRRENLSIDVTIPFVYKYDKPGTSQSMEVNDLGDISLGIKYQPFKVGKDWPSPIVSVGYTIPTGRGAYDIDPNVELATGSGLHSISGGISVSQPFDPVNTFASLSYSHSFTRKNIKQRTARGMLSKVEPGDTVGVSIGFGYALSYRMSLSLGLSFAYFLPMTYYWEIDDPANKNKYDIFSSGVGISSSLSLNTSWRISPSRRIAVGVSKGLTSDSSDFSLSVRLPIEFDLR